MADGVVSSVFPPTYFLKVDVIFQYVCNKCSVYETQLKEVLDELGSTRLISDILQEDLHLRLQRKRTAMTWLQRKDT